MNVKHQNIFKGEGGHNLSPVSRRVNMLSASFQKSYIAFFFFSQTNIKKTVYHIKTDIR